MSSKLLILETHPVQYHAPVYKKLAEMGVPVEVVYGSDFSIRGYRDREFGSNFAWDKDLTKEMKCHFLEPEAGSYGEVTGKGIGQALDKTRPQAALLCGYSHPFDKKAFVECRKREIPILLRAETTDHAVKRSWLKNRIRDWRLRIIYRQCGLVLPIGQRSRSHYRRLGVPEVKMVDSPYCVDESFFHWDESSRLKMRETKRKELEDRISDMGYVVPKTLILFSGKLVWRKGPDLLVEAARKLRKEGSDVGLVFCGSGEMETQLTKRCEELKTPAVFLGFVNQSGLSEVYHACDLSCLPSREGETWGLVVNEALLHGLPVVVSEGVGSAPDLVRTSKCGAIFETGKVESLVEGLKKVWLGGFESERRETCREAVAKFSTRSAAQGIVEAVKKTSR
ncbi:glycosyltransferase [bacterium]|nr:glycosyltransferase [bacterium]